MTPQVSENEFPHLRQFLASYFNEDWWLEHTSPVEAFEHTLEPFEFLYRRVVASFIADSAPRELLETADEIERLLEVCLTDEELHTVVTRTLGGNYWPGDNSGYRPWLRAVRGQLLAGAQGAR